jgi:hypothetical protein
VSTQTAVHIRFPSGYSEVTYAAELPQVGATLKRGDEEWVVVAAELQADGSAIVTLGPEDDGEVASDS